MIQPFHQDCDLQSSAICSYLFKKLFTFWTKIVIVIQNIGDWLEDVHSWSTIGVFFKPLLNKAEVSIALLCYDVTQFYKLFFKEFGWVGTIPVLIT